MEELPVINMMKGEKGQSLIEVLISLSVAVVITSAITISVITSLKNAQYTKNLSVATQYGQEGVEIMREMRATDYGHFKLLGSGTGKKYCLGKRSNKYADVIPLITGRCPQNVDAFVRQVTITNPGSCSNSVEVSISVFWSDSSCSSGLNEYCHHAENTTCISDYTVLPTPN